MTALPMTIAPSVTVTAADAATWRVEVLHRLGGLARVEHVDGCARVRVADAAPDGLEGGAEPLGSVGLCLHPDGRAAITALASPPVLLVAADGPRLLPEAPATRDEVDLCPGDVLVVCSADALENLRAGLGGVLDLAPRELALTDPRLLLERLMDGTDVGAAAIAVRLPTVPDEQEGT